jgi:hypothetical protein
MNKKLSKPPTPRKGLTVSERRAFIWASPRMSSLFNGAEYFIYDFTPAPHQDLKDVPVNIICNGVTAAFDQLYRHANIERTAHGFWALGHQAEGTRLIFEDTHQAAEYAEYLRELYLAADAGLCICGEPLDDNGHEGQEPESAPQKSKPKLPPPSSRTH